MFFRLRAARGDDAAFVSLAGDGQDWMGTKPIGGATGFVNHGGPWLVTKRLPSDVTKPSLWAPKPVTLRPEEMPT